MRIFRGIMPAVIIEIVLGFIIGAHGLHLAEATEQINFLAAFGFSYLMFLSGIELDFSLLFKKGSKGQLPPWAYGLLFFAITMAFSFVIATLLVAVGAVNNIVVPMLILSTTAVGIVTPALKGGGLLSSAFGQQVMVAALIADVFTLILFTAYITFHTSGEIESLFLVLLILLTFFFIYRAIRIVRRFKSLGIAENETSEIGLRGSFALILAFLALSQTLGTEAVIGAFLAGAIISLLSPKPHSILMDKLNAIGYGFLLPIFFVNVGMLFDFGELSREPSFWAILVLCLAGMFLNKIIPAHLFFRQYPHGQRTAAGLLLSSRLSLLIAASEIATKTGILSAELQNGFILLAVATCFVSPLLFNQMMKHEQ
jgi:Kef-type K+ transport system membrane component KefB